MRKIFCIIIIFIIASCNNMDFVYDNDKKNINPLYGKTSINTSGLELSFMNSYIPIFFGENNENIFNLSININEKKTKRSVETNQATSNLNYELRFNYTLISNQKNCVVYNKEIISSFSIIPKSAGYNYGTDASLEKKYEIAVRENLSQFVAILINLSLDNCS